jgi:hypothetical protein
MATQTAHNSPRDLVDQHRHQQRHDEDEHQAGREREGHALQRQQHERDADDERDLPRREPSRQRSAA